MKILLDENVSLRMADMLRKAGYEVFAVAETAERGMGDQEIWELACSKPFLLITRDYHFTNPVRFAPAFCEGILYIRAGNLTADDEIHLVQRFLAAHPTDQFRGRMVTLSPGSTRIR